MEDLASGPVYGRNEADHVTKFNRDPSAALLAVAGEALAQDNALSCNPNTGRKVPESIV